jgi:RNA polymerase sigma factor (sigma-70 family)
VQKVDLLSTRCDSRPVSDSRETVEAELRAHHTASLGWALACCRRNRVDAEDVLQQVYVKVLSGKAPFDGRSSFRTWLFGVIRLTALEHLRFLTLRWLHAPSAPEENLVSDAPSPSESIAERERAKIVSETLARLPTRQREVLHLTFYEGMALREAAEIMGVSLGTASQHYERGKERMHQLLHERGIV